MKPTISKQLKAVGAILIALGALLITCLTSCHKAGKERFKRNDVVYIHNIVLPGAPPYRITGIYAHALEKDPAQYAVISSDSVRYRNIQDSNLEFYP